MSQYALPLTLPALFSADNFFISDCNQQAWQWIDAWPKWPGHALLLWGASGSGKSHLGHLWIKKTGAMHIAAGDLDRFPQARRTNWLIEDIEYLKNERTLLHIFNAAKENGTSLLLTSASPASELPFTLPDLTSRLQACLSIHIGRADDAVIAGALRKQFSDRQMKVEEEVIAYMVKHIERSLSKVKELVELVDKEALREHRGITIPFIKRLFERASAENL